MSYPTDQEFTAMHAEIYEAGKSLAKGTTEAITQEHYPADAHLQTHLGRLRQVQAELKAIHNKIEVFRDRRGDW